MGSWQGDWNLMPWHGAIEKIKERRYIRLIAAQFDTLIRKLLRTVIITHLTHQKIMMFLIVAATHRGV